jgi:hypothetical protein
VVFRGYRPPTMATKEESDEELLENIPSEVEALGEKSVDVAPEDGDGEQAAAEDEEHVSVGGIRSDTKGSVASRAKSSNHSPTAAQDHEDLESGDERIPDCGIDSAMVGEEALSDAAGDAEEEGARTTRFDDAEEEDQPDPLIELQEKYEQLLELHERAMQNNVALQRRVLQRKANDKSVDAAEKQSDGKVTEHKYLNVLQNVHAERLKLRLQQVKAARMSEELKNQLEAKRQKAIECRDAFQEFKRQVARHAEYARTGKKIPEKIIQEVEEFELDKDAEVEEVRGSNISLKNRLAKLEQALRKKDELAENLHVIDFEQLKIENQTLNEKIEERNEELHKLRKKTIVTVQIITHMREKVQFVQQEYQVLKAELAQLDQELGAQRDLVAKTKHERDEHRTEFAKLKQQTGIMNSEHLTKDFEARAEHIRELKDSITALKKRHAQMTQFIKVHGGGI